MAETKNNGTPAKATPSQVRAFFENDGGDKVGARELMDLKKAGNAYDDIAYGIGNGTLTY